ncbi:arginine--tRNA ligase, partial [Stetteria hydrogenophila]
WRVKAGEGDRAKLEELAAALARLRERDPGGYFDRILRGVESLEDPEAEVRGIVARYEAGLEPERSEVRRVAGAVLESFKETLARLGVSFDAWDWESDLLWSGEVARILEEARRSRYYTTYKGAEALDIPRIIRELVEPDAEARRAFKLPRSLEVPPLILSRSGGTTLYATRDIAYTLYKFRAFNADRVVNVVGADQRLEQLQVRLALLGLGYRREALNTIHYDYEVVRLPWGRMRSRRGEAVWLDDVLDEAKARALEEVRSRNPGAPREWLEETAEKIAVGAVRFALVQTSAPKPVTIDLERILNLQENSGPYLQYTHARAAGILAKHGPIDWQAVDAEACRDAVRRRILLKASRLPLVAAKAADDMAPEDLAVYLLRLADDFNSWYQRDTVIHEPDMGARECKALIVHHFKENLALGLSLLGIPAPERM